MTFPCRSRLVVLLVVVTASAVACGSDSGTDALRATEDRPRVTVGERPERPERDTAAASTARGTSGGCDADTTVGVTNEGRFALAGDGTIRSLDGADADGLQSGERAFLLTVPDAHDGEIPVPLVLAYHGLAEQAARFAAVTDLSSLAADEGFVVVFPEGSGSPPRWDSRPGDNVDVTFTVELLDALDADLCLDRDRVYATGFSNGAFLVGEAACQLSDRLAAVALVSGARAPATCDLSRPVPVLAMHGTADPILGFNGGVGSIPGIWEGDELEVDSFDASGPGFPTAMGTWAERNGCLTTPSTRADDERITKTYDCPARSAVVFEIVVDGGHTWPGSVIEADADRVGPTAAEPDASAEIWSFLQRHSLAG
jgi:polyhydroxybutyrate depolymerase